MSSMLEQVAERLLNVMRKRNGWPPTTLDSMLPEHRAELLEDARVAVEALRVPTPTMVIAGVAGIDAVEGDCATEEGTSAGYTAMIDAILAEDTP